MPRIVKTSVELVVPVGGISDMSTWVSVLSVSPRFESQLFPLLCYVFLSKLINHPVPHFPHVQREHNNSTHHTKLRLGSTERIHVKHLDEGPEENKQVTSICWYCEGVAIIINLIIPAKGIHTYS